MMIRRGDFSAEVLRPRDLQKRVWESDEVAVRHLTQNLQ